MGDLFDPKLTVAVVVVAEACCVTTRLHNTNRANVIRPIALAATLIRYSPLDRREDRERYPPLPPRQTSHPNNPSDDRLPFILAFYSRVKSASATNSIFLAWHTRKNMKGTHFPFASGR